MPPGTSLEETDRVLQHIEQHSQARRPEVESYSRRTGTQLGLRHHRAQHRRLPGEAEARTRPLAGRDHRRSARRRSRSPSRSIDIEFVAHSGRPDRRSRLVARTDRDQALQPATTKPSSKAADRITEWLPKVKGVVDINNRTVVIGPAVNFRRRSRQSAARAGFSVQDVADDRGSDASTAAGRQHDPRQSPGRHSRSLSAASIATRIEKLNEPAPDLAHRRNRAALEHRHGAGGAGQTEIHRDNLRNMTAVTARLSGRDLGSAIDEIRVTLAQRGATSRRHRDRVRRPLPDPARVLSWADAGAVGVDAADLHHSGLRIPLVRASDRDPGRDGPVRVSAPSLALLDHGQHPEYLRRSWARSWWSASSTRTAS